MKLVDTLVKNKYNFEVLKFDTSIFSDKIPIYDETYFKFLKLENGGFFFKKAIHLYSFGVKDKLHDFIEINALLKAEYGQLLNDFISFGQDLFGNQFGYSNNSVQMFSIESGEFELLASTFDEWINIILKDSNYFIGENLLKKWKKKNAFFDLTHRLCPKVPFIVGGEFKVENLYSLQIDKNIMFNASIAHQVYNLPDGQEIKFNFVK